MIHSRCRGLAPLAALLALALCGAARAEEAVEAPPQPKLPEGVQALSQDIQDRLEGLVKGAEKYRGLPGKAKVAMGQLDREGLKKKLVHMFKEEMPPETLDPIQKVYRAFGLIPAELDLNAYYPQLLTSQVGGFYEPKEKYLVLVNDPEGQNAQLAKQFGAELAGRMDDMVMVHELTHALQDQHFDLSKYGHDAPLSDAAAAKLALIEGDATHVMYSHFFGMGMERVPMVEASLKMMTRNPKDLIAMMPEMPGAKEMMEAPAIIRDSLLFSYMQGLEFVVAVRKAGGQKLLDYAFVKDPPKSTEQILHPEKWLARRDVPVGLEMPDLAGPLPGYAKVSQGTWGEFGVRVLLADLLGDAERAQAEKAAAGWGGDAFALYAKDKAEVLAWITEWDGEEEAREFEASTRAAFPEGRAAVLRGGTRVLLVKGGEALGDAARENLYKALFAAKAERPASPDLDYAALGITDADKPPSANMGELAKMLQDPSMQKMLENMGGDGGMDLKKLMGEDGGELAKLLGEDGGELAKLLGGDGGLDLGKLLSDPNVQAMAMQMLEQMQKNKPKLGKGNIQDGVYTNPGEGLRIKKPDAEGWAFSETPTELPVGSPLAELKGDGGKATVAVVTQPLPMPVPIEMLPMSMEMGLKMQFETFKKVKSGFVDRNGQKGYEMEFSGGAGGENVHILQLVFIKGNNMLMIVGTTAEDAWEKNRKAIEQAVGSFEFLPKAAPAPEKQPEELKE
ncbi:MAG: hypothetical protein M5U26_26775 [Planctomycetota bacterium]|nr:hypothetical protein [Planctomycetota bacterium]